MKILIGMVLVWVSWPMAAQGQQASVNFSRQILPILSDKCFVCHGPDARDEDLVRLDSSAGATADLGGYFAINSAALEESEILDRIHSTDNPMPPDDSTRKLTADETDLLTRWVKQGGKYTKHWAFVSPVKASTTVDQDPDSAIDALVDVQLKTKGIDFAPAAERETLARRVALVLTGLPPEPELLRGFTMTPARKRSFGIRWSWWD